MKICNLRNKISILQITEFCFVIYIFLFRKLQIFISQIKDFRFVLQIIESHWKRIVHAICEL